MHEVDAFVVDRLRALGQDEELIGETARAARDVQKERLAELRVEARRAKADIARLQAEHENLDGHEPEGRSDIARRLGDIDEALGCARERLQAAQAETKALKGTTLHPADLRDALRAFMPVWDALFPAERARVMNLLVERVVYDAAAGELTMHYRPAGIRLLAEEAAS